MRSIPLHLSFCAFWLLVLALNLASSSTSADVTNALRVSAIGLNVSMFLVTERFHPHAFLALLPIFLLLLSKLFDDLYGTSFFALSAILGSSLALIAGLVSVIFRSYRDARQNRRDRLAHLDATR